MQYVIQIIAFQLFFLIVYDVFLKRETFFNWNRGYLLATSVMSMVLPFIRVNAFKEVVPKEYIIGLPEVVIGNVSTTNHIELDAVVMSQPSFSWSWETVFYIGAFLAFLFFVFKVIRITALVYKNPKRWKGNVLLVKLLNSSSAFSFLHYVFLGERLEKEEKETILKHELVHVNQKHTLDLLFFELQRIVFWFNPLVYMYQNRLRTLHEYIADQEALKTQNRSDYYQNLLGQVFETKNVSFINTFFKQSLIKKRIIMLQKDRSSRINLVKYVFLIPIVLGMLIYSASYAQEKEVSVLEMQELTDAELKEQLYEEFLEEEKSGRLFEKGMKDKYFGMNKYIQTKTEYLRSQISTERAYSSANDASEAKIQPSKKMKRQLKRTYQEYLEWKQTDEAKEIWENNSHDGILRLVVNKIGELTDQEKKKKEEKIELLNRDPFFTKLVISDTEYDNAYFSITITPEENKKKTNKKRNVLVQEEEEVPFAVIDQFPLYEECQDLSKKEQRKCITEKISKHVQTNFNIDLAGDLELTGRQRISVVFKINKEGDIEGIRARATHPKLEEEAKRVVKLLPKMIPGKHKGKAVIVPYSLPIIFEVAEKKVEPIKPVKGGIVNDEVPYAKVDEPPMFEACKDKPVEARRKCTSDNISKYVQKNFNIDLAGNLGLKGRQRISVIFKISKEGNVIDVKSRAPHPKLEEEAIRVVSSLPKMFPGKHQGKTVVVPYALPIIFQVAEDDTNNDIPFAVVDEVPVYPGCESKKTNDERKKCISNKISEFVAKNFNTKVGEETPSQKNSRIMVMFRISENGTIDNIKARSSNPKMENEAIRVIKLLPKMKPAKHKGKEVSVRYSLPISYVLGKKRN